MGAVEIAMYAGIVCWLTWPLPLQARTHLPGVSTPDTLHGIWALAWSARALSTHPGRLFDAPILHPTPGAFFFAPNGLGPTPVFAPLYLLDGNPVRAVVGTLLACLVLTAWGLHRLATRWTGSWAAGLVAGAAFLTSPTWTLYLTMWPTYLSVYYFPWIIGLVALPSTGAVRIVLLATLVALQCLADPVYVAPAVLAPIGVIALARLAMPGHRRSALGLLAALALAAGALSPLYAGFLRAREQTFSGTPVASASQVWRTLAEPLSLPWHPGFVPVTYTTLGLVVAGLATVVVRWRSVAGRTRRAWAHGAVWTLVGLLVSAPTVALLGSSPLDNPLHRLLDAAAPGVLDLLRGMQRLSLGMTMGLAALAGLGFAALGPARSRRPYLRVLLAAGAAAAMYGEWRARMLDAGLYHARPGERVARYTTRDAPRGDTRLVQALRAGHGPVLELPLVHTLAGEASYRAIFHERPILNGFASHQPRDHAERMRLAFRLPDRAALQALQRAAGLTAIVVRKFVLASPATGWAAVHRNPGAVPGLRLVLDDDDVLLFEVDPDRLHGR